MQSSRSLASHIFKADPLTRRLRTMKGRSSPSAAAAVACFWALAAANASGSHAARLQREDGDSIRRRRHRSLTTLSVPEGADAGMPLEDQEVGPTSYIIGGSIADQNRFHWFTGLLYNRCDETSGRCGWARTACGSSLVHKDMILTAAHCIPFLQDDMDENAAYIGMHSPLITNNDGQTMEIIGLQKVIVHPDYDRISQAHDLALIKLKYKAQANPVRLDDGSSSWSSSRLSALGFGIDDVNSESLTDQLMSLDFRYVSPSVCSLIYDDYFRGTGHITPDMMCAQALRSGTDTCTGDSGGPLFRQGISEQDDLLIGITSWGIGCAQDYPGVYTSVSHHIAFIKNTICEHSSFPPTYCQDLKSSTFVYGADIDATTVTGVDKRRPFYDTRRGVRTSCSRLRRHSKRRRRKAKALCREMIYKTNCPATCGRVTGTATETARARKSCSFAGAKCQESSMCCSHHCEGDGTCA